MNPALTTLVVVLALLASSLLGSVVVALVLRSASRSADAGAQPAPTPAPAGAPGADAPAASSSAVDSSATDSSALPTAPGTPDRALSDGPDGPRARAVLRGGRWIGLLERLAVTGAILAGDPAAIAVVVAIKGLGRYPELRDNPGVSERFVIGTLASLTWAALTAWTAQRLLSL